MGVGFLAWWRQRKKHTAAACRSTSHPPLDRNGWPTGEATHASGLRHARDASMIRGQLKGDMRFDWRAEGLACEIVLPV
jgi:hypothetical protein